MAILTIEFYEDDRNDSVTEANVYGRLISSVEDTSLSTTPENAAVPDNCTYISVYSDTASYIEIGEGNQDCGATRRSIIPAGMIRDFSVRGTDIVSYRSIA